MHLRNLGLLFTLSLKKQDLKKLLLILSLLSTSYLYGQPPADGSAPSSIEVMAAIESSLKIFPNPAKSFLTINMKLPSVSQARIALHDMLGNELEVLTENATGIFDKTFDINTLKSGIYFVRINYNGQNTIVKKIIVQ